MSNITYEYIRRNKDIQTYINYADAALSTIGYTEHSNAHVERAAASAFMILTELGYEQRTCELAEIAAYMHDIGNVINRVDHAQSGAIMAFRLLDNLGMPANEISLIISAIGNHDENTAAPVTPKLPRLLSRTSQMYADQECVPLMGLSFQARRISLGISTTA